MLYSFDGLTRSNVEVVDHQTHGPKGYFDGSRKIFIESQLPEYIAGKRGSRQGFWHRFYCTWWQRYPWKLGDDEEPPTNDPAKMTSLASVAPGEDVLKKAVERKLVGVR